MSTSPLHEPDVLAIALRVFAERCVTGDELIDDLPRRTRRVLQRRLPHRVLVFDTETTTDETQRLIFGSWRYFVDRRDHAPGHVCVEEGIVYADDLPERDPETYARLVAYVRTQNANVTDGFPNRIRFLSRSEFVEQILFQYGYRQRALIVGFNLPFDLTRLAIDVGDARGRFAGGLSLRLFELERYRPRIVYKTIDSRRHLIGFTKPDGDDERFRGHFLDLRTLCFALSDRAGSLERCSDQFGAAYTKRAVAHGHVDEDYITYCREDVAATAALFRAAMAEYLRHPIDLQPTKALSPASIGKAYLRAMRIRPILERQPDFPTDVLGYGMAAFFGGRAECRIRRWPLPIIYVDFLSMYPTVNTLMGSWRLLTARRIDTVDVTPTVQRLLNDKRLFELCFTRELWRELLTLVEIEPGGDLVPVRARYDEASHDYGIGINPYWLDGTAWYTLADLIASVVLTRRVPRVVRAVRMRAVGRQRGLRTVALRGTVEIDPTVDDFFQVTIEERKRADQNADLPDDERKRLSQFLKTTANATSYGTNAEYVQHEQHQHVGVHVYSDVNFATTIQSCEDPGEYCFPPLAACITGAARLMLALLQRCVTDAGGSYVFCDTDSMAIVANQAGGLIACPGGSHTLDDQDAVRALSRDDVVGIVERFAALNPYERDVIPGSVLKIEAENYSGRQWCELWCWAISAKRYCLYHLDDNGEPVIVKASEHGLGHLLNPTDPDNPTRAWITEAWAWLLRHALGLPAPDPRWLDRMAASRITVSTPAVLHWFDTINRDRTYAEQIKPANFMLVFHPDPLDGNDGAPIAPYEADPNRSRNGAVINRRTGEPIAISTELFDGHDSPGLVHVRTYRSILAAYLAHPETKSLAPDRTPCRRNTRGLLQVRPVRGVLPAHYVGKEANRIDDRVHGLVDTVDEYRTEYVGPADRVWRDLVVPALKMTPRAELIERSGLHRRTIERLLLNGARPHPANREGLVKIAVDYATTQLQVRGMSVPSDTNAILQRYLRSTV
jgi:hypothetical protein